jgi:hypothetical protein
MEIGNAFDVLETAGELSDHITKKQALVALTAGVGIAAGGVGGYFLAKHLRNKRKAKTNLASQRPLKPPPPQLMVSPVLPTGQGAIQTQPPAIKLNMHSTAVQSQSHDAAI